MKKRCLNVVPAPPNEERNYPQPERGETLELFPRSEKQINDYVELKKLIKKNGLLAKQPLYYTYKLITTLGMLALSVVLLFVIHAFWFQLLNAMVLAVVSARYCQLDQKNEDYC